MKIGNFYAAVFHTNEVYCVKITNRTTEIVQFVLHMHGALLYLVEETKQQRRVSN